MQAQILLDSNCTCTLNVNLPTDINYWIFVLLTKCVACDHIYLEKTWSLSHLMKHMAGIKCSFSSLFNGGMSRGCCCVWWIERDLYASDGLPRLDPPGCAHAVPLKPVTDVCAICSHHLPLKHACSQKNTLTDLKKRTVWPEISSDWDSG